MSLARSGGQSGFPERRPGVSLRPLAFAAALPLVAGCSSGPIETSTDATSWVGTITTEGDVTTVVNQSGSIWGGPVALAEVLSIGQESGAEPYLFGAVRAVGATEERIYVLDLQVSMVRVYDQTGAHLFDVGGRGQGPGDFNGAMSIAVDPAGRLLVQDRTRVSVFDLDGNFIETWPYIAGGVVPLVARLDGGAFVSSGFAPEGQSLAPWVAVAPDGSEERRIAGPEFDPSPWYMIASSGGRERGMVVPHGPDPMVGAMPTGAIVRGTSDTYSFEIEYPDGSNTIVEKPGDRVPVSEEERDWLVRNRTAVMRRTQPDWSWDANPVPAFRPAFDAFFGDRFGRIWVHRSVGVEVRSDCGDPAAVDERPPPRSCWDDRWGFDVFEEESGRLLGQVALPPGYQASGWPALLADDIVVVVEDEAGTTMIKRYRLVLPGER